MLMNSDNKVWLLDHIAKCRFFDKAFESLNFGQKLRILIRSISI